MGPGASTCYWFPRDAVLTLFEYRYFLALHRPGSSKLILRPTPVYPISRQIKALKNFKPTETEASEQFQARNTLGKAFGTKKAKAAIQAHERNKVDVSAMEDVAGVLQDRIDEGTENLPTQGMSRLPPFLVNRRLTLKGPQKKWKNRQTLRVSYLRTMRMLKDRKTFIRCIISSQRWNGPP